MIELSLCMIVKNESIVLARCLDSIADLMDEIIIVDTGSTDNTKEIASKYTDKVYDFEWTHNFAAARNYAFSKATKDYIYTADADEVIDEENRERFRLLKQAILPEIEIVQMYYITDMKYNTTENFVRDMRPKIYKRLREFVWINALHETVRLEPLVFNSDVEVLHKPTSDHSKRDFEIFNKIIEREGGLNNKLHMMYAREVYKNQLDNYLDNVQNYFEKELNKNIYSDDDYARILQSVAVLSKIYQEKKNDRGLLALIWYLIREDSFKETLRMIDKMYGNSVNLLDGIHKLEYEIAIKDRRDMNISSELALNVGIRLQEENEYEESKKWFLMAQDIVGSILDIDSSTVLPQKYMEIFDKGNLKA